MDTSFFSKIPGSFLRLELLHGMIGESYWIGLSAEVLILVLAEMAIRRTMNPDNLGQFISRFSTERYQNDIF